MIKIYCLSIKHSRIVNYEGYQVQMWTFLKRLSAALAGLCLRLAGLSIYSKVSAFSSIRPVITFSFILNFRQLSSLVKPLFFLSLFLVIIRGESHYSLMFEVLLFSVKALNISSFEKKS